jgi:hypothetical protein
MSQKDPTDRGPGKQSPEPEPKNEPKHKWVKQHKKKLARLLYEASGDFMERPPPPDYED